MTSLELHHLPRLLGAGDAPATGAQLPFSGPPPRIDVDGFGEVHTPVQPTELQRLLSFAQPAAYGKGEQTLVDRQVRDTWQIPPDLVDVGWHGQLDDVVETARRALDLPGGAALRAQFHSMLVYERGQFFLPHQDSQKDEDMVATLVVTMLSPGAAGELAVHAGNAAPPIGRRGRRRRSRPSTPTASTRPFRCALAQDRGRTGTLNLVRLPELGLLNAVGKTRARPTSPWGSTASASAQVRSGPGQLSWPVALHA